MMPLITGGVASYHFYLIAGDKLIHFNQWNDGANDRCCCLRRQRGRHHHSFYHFILSQVPSLFIPANGMTALMTGGTVSGGNSDAITIQLKENPSKDEAPSVAGFFLPISAIGKHLAASLQVCVTIKPFQRQSGPPANILIAKSEVHFRQNLHLPTLIHSFTHSFIEPFIYSSINSLNNKEHSFIKNVHRLHSFINYMRS